MTYEEKYLVVLKAIYEAEKYARDSEKVNLYITKDNGLASILLKEIHDILLQLEETEFLIALKDIPTKLKPSFEINLVEIDYFELVVTDKFDDHYTKLLLKQKSSIENLSKNNLDNISQILNLIEEQLEISQSENLTIEFVSSIHEVEGYDSSDIDDLIGVYTQGLSYLKNTGIIKSYTTGKKQLYSEICLDVPKFFDVLEKVKRLQKPKTASKKQKTKKEKKRDTKINNWPEDFRWEGKQFIFGKYGKISFNSKDRRHILKTLTNKKGDWATISELKEEKDAGFVRSTIKQIKDRFPEKTKDKIKIISTLEDNSDNKPNEGAYKIVLSTT